MTIITTIEDLEQIYGAPGPSSTLKELDRQLEDSGARLLYLAPTRGAVDVLKKEGFAKAGQRIIVVAGAAMIWFDTTSCANRRTGRATRITAAIASSAPPCSATSRSGLDEDSMFTNQPIRR